LVLIPSGGWVIFCDRLTDGIRVGCSCDVLGFELPIQGYMRSHFIDTRDYRPKPSITNVNFKHSRCISLARSRGKDLDKGASMDLSSNDDIQ